MSDPEIPILANSANEANDLAPLANLAPSASASSRDSHGRFVTGNNGGGRPKGSRNRLSDVLLSVIVDDLTEHGATAIAQLRQSDPATYFRLISSLAPRELILQAEQENVVDYAKLSDAEVFDLIGEERRRKLITSALRSV